jgi:hypothetical protein
VPCFACNARQIDPERGPSSWKKLVRGGEQVLVCPDCARKPGWDDAADRCPACGSTALRKALGTVRCAACGAVSESVPGPGDEQGGRPTNLSEEVAAAVDRIFGRAPSPVSEVDAGNAAARGT